MKKMFRNLMLVAVAAMAFVACQNDTDGVNVTPEQDTITMTFFADAPESRTSVAIDGKTATYSWNETDVIGFYYVGTEASDTAKNKKKKKSSTISIADNGVATFEANFESIDGASTYNIGAFYPDGSWVNHDDEKTFNNVKVKILTAQTLTAGSFDPNADLMMSKPFMGVALENNSVKSLEFTRIAAIGKMNLKLNDMVEGEIIKSVKFTLAEGTHFNGPVFLDLENSTYTLGEENTSNFVNLTGGELAANTDRTAIFFTCFPGEYTGAYTIEVETDKAYYSKTGEITKPLTFTAGNVLNFNATTDSREDKLIDESLSVVTYTVSSTSACTTSGTAPNGSSASYSQTYNTKEQLTSGNSATFTLTGYEGATIKAITLNMKSNASKGAGKFSVTAGSESLAGISQATNFNKWYDNKTYGSTYRDINVTMTNDSYVVKSDESVVVKFEATTNSIYIHSITISYLPGVGGETGGDDNTGGETGGDDNTEVAKSYTLQFGKSYNSKGISSYIDSWSATCDGFTWNITNANNNNNGWNYIKMGSKNNESVGTIVTNTAMSEAIKTVTMTVDAVTTSKIKSLKLYVATDSSFKNNVQTISVEPAKGDLTFNITTPTKNCYYKLEADCAKGSSNGLITISKVVYTNN